MLPPSNPNHAYLITTLHPLPLQGRSPTLLRKIRTQPTTRIHTCIALEVPLLSRIVLGDHRVHGETPPPIDWISGCGKTRADTICTGPGPSKRNRKGNAQITEASKTSFCQVLNSQVPTALIPKAGSGGLGGTRRVVHKYSRGFQPAPSLCVCRLSQLTE